MTSPTSSAVIIAVPEVDRTIGHLRQGLDPTAAWGIPAHATVLAPFLPPSRIGTTELRRLRAALASVGTFDSTLADVRWFREDVVWLAPEPEEKFRDLTMAVWNAFPHCAPYGGAFPDVIPHVTIGARADPQAMRAAASAVAAFLPIRFSVTTAHLYLGSDRPDGWRRVAALRLATDGAARAERSWRDDRSRWW